MRVLRATESQKNILNGISNGPHRIEFVWSEIGWIIGAQVLEDYAHSPFLQVLQNLEQADYEPPQESEGGLWNTIKSFFS